MTMKQGRMIIRVNLHMVILLVCSLSLLASAQQLGHQNPNPNPNQLGAGGLSPQDMASLMQDLQNHGFLTAATLMKFLGGSILGSRMTLLVPTDLAIANSISHLSPDALQYPSILQQHILPRNLAYSQLQLLPADTWLPTALPTFGVHVTSIGGGRNFSLNGAQIVKPDMCASVSLALLSCHGIDTVLTPTRSPTFSSP